MLKSDFLLVRPPGAERFVEFRDVFEVDGRPVRDRQDRLTRLFLDTSANTDRIRAIIEDSARYNIGNIPRNVNTPMLPLVFLQEVIGRASASSARAAERPDLAALALTGRGGPEHFRASHRGVGDRVPREAAQHRGPYVQWR